MKIKHIGLGNLLIILITLALFIAALFTKDFAHDLFLEAAVFLVSVKLIIIGYRNSRGVEEIKAKLDSILDEEKHLEAVLMSIRKKSGKETDKK